MDITRLHELQEGLCDTFHKTVCSCVQRSDDTRAILQRLAHEYQAVADKIGKNPRYQTDGFSVSVQPFFIDTLIPHTPDGKPDRSYFAPDCFHFALKAHAAAAVGLWNNMVWRRESERSYGFELLVKMSIFSLFSAHISCCYRSL